MWAAQNEPAIFCHLSAAMESAKHLGCSRFCLCVRISDQLPASATMNELLVGECLILHLLFKYYSFLLHICTKN